LESFEKVKKSWSHELKCASNHDYENARCQVERRTHNHWHGRLETYPLCYEVDAAWLTNWLLYWNRVMWDGMVE